MKNEIRPENGSLMVLNTNSESGSVSLTLRIAGSPLLAVGSGFHFAALDRRRHVVHDEVEYFVGADVAQT